MARSAHGVRPAADGMDLAPAPHRCRHLGRVHAELTAAADAAGLIDWSLSVESTIARAHQRATNMTRLTGGWIELQESGRRAA